MNNKSQLKVEIVAYEDKLVTEFQRILQEDGAADGEPSVSITPKPEKPKPKPTPRLSKTKAAASPAPKGIT